MKLGRFIILIACSLWAYSPVQAQIPEYGVTLDLAIKPLFPQYPHDWSTSDDNALLTISNETQDIINAKIDVQVRIGDTIYARARLFTLPLLQIVPGITTYTAAGIFPSAELEFYRIPQQNTAVNTPLPAGSYTLCLQLIEENGSQPLSLPICRPFSIAGAVSPVLHYPARIVDLAFTPEEILHFRWELPYAVAPAPTQWILRVVEANTGGSDSIDILTGDVVLERIIRDSTNFILTTPSTFFTAGSRYLWSVRPAETISKSTATNSMTTGALSTTWAVPMSFTIMRTDAPQQRR